MKKVVSISLGKSDQDYEFTTQFMGQEVNVKRFGADGNVDRAVELLKHWENHADAIGLGMVKDHYAVGSRRFEEAETTRMSRVVNRVPVTTGARLRGILQEWAVRHVQISLGNFFNNANILFFSGMTNFKLAAVLSEYTQNLQFADPLLQLGVPKLLTSLGALELYANGSHYVSNWVPSGVLAAGPLKDWTRYLMRKAMQKASVIVAQVQDLDDYSIEEFAGKTIITSSVNDERIARFKEKGVNMIIDGSPHMFERAIGRNVIEAMFIAVLEKDPDDIMEDDYLSFIADLNLEPRIIYPSGFKRVNRFAFVIHPLSQEYFKNVKPVEVLSHISPPVMMNSLEKIMAYAPVSYTHLTGAGF